MTERIDWDNPDPDLQYNVWKGFGNPIPGVKSMKNKTHAKEVYISFSAKFGSGNQYDVAMQSLEAMLVAWSQFYSTIHKNNQISGIVMEVKDREDTNKVVA